MRTTSSVIAMIALLTCFAWAEQPVTSMAVECNWGRLTMESAPLGGHSSDPSGDGLGPEKHVGLANVIEQGNLQATCEFIEGIIEADAFDSGEPEVTAMSVKCNWGQLTMKSAPLGDHSSDPSGDGLGPEDRVGLANILEQGNLQAVCEFLGGE